MNEPITIKFSLTKEDWLRAWRRHLLQNSSFKWNVFWIVFSFLIGGVAWLATHFLPITTAAHWVLWACTGGLTLAEIVRFEATPRQVLGKAPEILEERSYSFLDESIRIITTKTDAQVKWDKYCRVISDRYSFLLYSGKISFPVIPRRAFANAEQEKAFEEMMRRHIEDVKKV